jgi:hypothetical protein
MIQINKTRTCLETRHLKTSQCTFEVEQGQLHGGRFEELGVVVDEQHPDATRVEGEHLRVHDRSRHHATRASYQLTDEVVSERCLVYL